MVNFLLLALTPIASRSVGMGTFPDLSHNPSPFEKGQWIFYIGWERKRKRNFFI
jgi:hypothetical protein